MPMNPMPDPTTIPSCSACSEPIPDPAERWPAFPSGTVCQVCWEAQSSRLWWAMVQLLSPPIPPAMTATPQTKHFPDLGFTVCATAYTHHVDFVVYDIEAWQEGATPEVYDMPLWHKAGAPSHPDPVNCIEEAEPYLHGEVKWDGCSNWHFDEQDRIMLHGCTRHDVLRFGEVMAECWDWAAELCPAWNP